MGGVSRLMESEQEETWKGVHEIATEGHRHIIPMEAGKRGI